MALCTVEKAIDFTAKKDVTVIAVISKVAAPSNPQEHKADLYIESMEVVPKEDIGKALQMMSQLQRVSTAGSGDPDMSVEIAWKQKKCRRLNRYPTLT